MDTPASLLLKVYENVGDNTIGYFNDIVGSICTGDHKMVDR